MIIDTRVFRSYCSRCLQPEVVCYCAQIQRFDPKIEFAILIHPIEKRRRVASGRMSHFSLERSHFIPGHDYTHDDRVNALIENVNNFSVILYPGPSSSNLSELEEESRCALFPSDKNLIIFVIDGTWKTAGKTMRLSENLKKLPRISFLPLQPSQFRVRKQPKPECYSTLEAIHHTIELIGHVRGFDVSQRAHDRLLRPFHWMIEKQLSSYQVSNRRRVRPPAKTDAGN